MYLVDGPWDIPGDRALAGLHDPDGGHVVVSAPPDAPSLGALAAAVLRAMGKSASAAPGWERTADETRWARVWLEAFGIRAVSVQRSNDLDPSMIAAFDDLVRSAGATLYAICDPQWTAFLNSRLADRVEQRWTIDDYQSAWRTASLGAVSAPHPRSRTESLEVAKRLRRIREPQRPFDPAYLVGLTRAAGFPRPERPTAALLAQRLRATLSEFDDPRCFAGAVAGTAIAQRPFGWEIVLDADQLARGPSPRPIPAATADAPYRCLWVFRDPLMGASAALTQLPVTLAEVLGLTLADVAVDGSMVAVCGEWYELPADARPVVRAQLIERRLDGATSDDVLLVRPKGQPRTEAWLLSTVRAAAAKTHLRVLDEDLRHRPSEAERWLLERGVTLEWIPRRERSDRLSRVEDPAKIAVDVRAALVALDEAAPCACSVPHHPVPAAEFTGWPPVPKRAHTQFDTGSRRNAYGRRRDRPA